MKIRSFAIILIVALCFTSTKSIAQNINYYIDSIGGSDANTGKSPTAAWQTITKVNATTFKAGDSVLFKCGSVWSGVTLHPLGSGTTGKPIVISKYGNGNLPLLKGNTSTVHLPYVVYLNNQQYITISNLEITNNYQQTNTGTASKRGVYVTAKDLGIVHCVTLKDLEIHDVLGSYYSDVTTGGIFCDITGSSKATWYDSLLIDHCHVYNVDRTGISNQSTWNGNRTITSNSGWYPSTHLVVQNCEVDSSGANSIIIRVSQSPIIQYNKVYKSSIRYSGNSIFVFNCNDALIQYNEGSYNVYNAGDADASAFDGDYRCHRTVIQYNYSHDNDGGAWVVVSDPSLNGTFDDSCIIRYNISQNDCHDSTAQEASVVRIAGNITNTTVYNNTIYSSKDAVNLINHCGWGGSKTGVLPDVTNYYNNIFYINKNNAQFSFNSSTGNTLNYNTFYYAPGYSGSNPIDANVHTTDPMFVNPGTGGDGMNTVDGYKLKIGSPEINAGILLANHSKTDFWKNKVPATTGVAPCRGAYEYSVIMPVTLSSFSGAKQEHNNVLTWVSTEEINNTGFEVQRSNDGKEFTDIYFVPTRTATGNSVGEIKYQFVDDRPLNGNNYYRLKQIDRNGSITYSIIIVLKNDTQLESSFSVYPNPIKGESINLHFNNMPSGKYSIQLFNNAGQLVSVSTINHTDGSSVETIKTTQEIKGTNTIIITSPKGVKSSLIVVGN